MAATCDSSWAPNDRQASIQSCRRGGEEVGETQTAIMHIYDKSDPGDAVRTLMGKVPQFRCSVIEYSVDAVAASMADLIAFALQKCREEQVAIAQPCRLKTRAELFLEDATYLESVEVSYTDLPPL